MALNEWKLWEKIGLVKKSEFKEVRSEEDLEAVLEFLEDINVKQLIVQVEKMREMVHEHKVIHEDLKKANIEKQIKRYDDFFEEVI